MRSKGPHSRSSSLVHAHGRPAHVRVVHGRCHAGWIYPSRGTSWTRLVHELVVVGLSRAHLEGRAHLEAKRKISGYFLDRCLFLHVLRMRVLYLSILVHVLILGFLQSCHRGRRCGRRRGGSGCNSGRCGSSSWLSEVARGTCVRGNSHSTRRGIWASRITAETRRAPFNDESKFHCQQI